MYLVEKSATKGAKDFSRSFAAAGSSFLIEERERSLKTFAGGGIWAGPELWRLLPMPELELELELDCW